MALLSLGIKSDKLVQLMASLIIRNLEDETIQRLRILAAEHQVPMEEEVRRILQEAVAPEIKIGDLALEYFGEKYGVDLVLPKHKSHEPLSFNYSIDVKLAVKLFAEGNISVGKATKLAKMGIAEFTEHLSEQGIAIVDFTEEEFDLEMAYLNSL